MVRSYACFNRSLTKTIKEIVAYYEEGREIVDFLLAWYNLIFLVPVLTGVVAALAATTGFGMETGEAGESDGFDGDSDDVSGHAVDVHSDGNLFERALSLLGVGRVPLSIVITVSSLTFGVTGILLNFFLFSVLKSHILTTGASSVGAFAAMLVITNGLAGWLSRVLPSVETYGVSHTGLEGRVGTLVLSANTEFGIAHVYDEHRELHRVQCKTYQGTIPEGTEVVIIHYEKSESVYYVEATSAWRMEAVRNKKESVSPAAGRDETDEKEEKGTVQSQNNYEGTKS